MLVEVVGEGESVVGMVIGLGEVSSRKLPPFNCKQAAAAA